MSQDLFKIIQSHRDPSDFLFRYLYGTERFRDNRLFQAEAPEVICGTTWGKGGIAFRCMDCEKDHNCVVCSACYFDSEHLHAKHRVKLIRTTGGCCDCGDVSSWSETGCCSKHGPNRSVHVQDIELSEREQEVFSMNGQSLIPNLVQVVTQSITVNINTHVTRSGLNFLLQCVRNVFFEPLVLNCFDPDIISTWIQVCCVLGGRNPRPRPPVMSLPSLEDCGVIARGLVDFFLALVQRNAQFKKLFTRVYVSHYSSIIQFRGVEDLGEDAQGGDLGSLSVQLFTIPEVCEYLLGNRPDDNVLVVLIENLNHLMNSLKDPQSGKWVARDLRYHIDIMMWRVIHDLGYCLHHDSVADYLLAHQGLLGGLVGGCLKPMQHANIQALKHGDHVLYENTMYHKLFMYENLMISTLGSLCERARKTGSSELIVRTIIAHLEPFSPLLHAGENASFHVPLIRLLIHSIDVARVAESEELASWIPSVLTETVMRQILIECMRPLLFLREINDSIWRRNGEAVLAQASDFEVSEPTMMSGIALCQILMDRLNRLDPSVELFRAMAILCADIPDDAVDDTTLVRERIARFDEPFSADDADEWLQLFIRDTLFGGHGSRSDASRRKAALVFMFDVICRLTTDGSYVFLSQLTRNSGSNDEHKKSLLKRCIVQRMHGNRLSYTQILNLIPSALRQPESMLDEVLETITSRDNASNSTYKINAEGLKLLDVCHRAFGTNVHAIEELIVKQPTVFGSRMDDSISESVTRSLLKNNGFILRLISGLLRVRLCELKPSSCLTCATEPEITPQALDAIITMLLLQILDNIRTVRAGRKSLLNHRENDPQWHRPPLGTRMKIEGLVQRADLNGLEGIYFGKQEGRLCLSVGHHGRILAKESNTINLQLIDCNFAKTIIDSLMQLGSLDTSKASELCVKAAKELVGILSHSTGVVSGQGSPEVSAVFGGEDPAQARLDKAKQRQAMLMRKMKVKQSKFESVEEEIMEGTEIECAMCRESDHGSRDMLVALGFCASGNAIYRSVSGSTCVASPVAPYLNACMHVVHQCCWNKHVDASSSRLDAMGAVLFLGRPSHGEVLCPVCRSLTNLTIPLVDASHDEESIFQSIVDFGESLLEKTRESSGTELSGNLWLARDVPCWRPFAFSTFMDTLVEVTYNEIVLSSSLSPSKILSPNSLHMMLVKCLQVLAVRNNRPESDWHIWTREAREAGRVDCGRLFVESGLFDNDLFMKQVMALRYLQLEHCGTTEEHVDAGMAQLALVMAWIHSSVVSFSASDLNRLAFLPEDSRSRLSILEQVLGIGDWKDHISILRESLSWTGHIAPVSVPNGQLVKVDLPDKLTDLIKKTIGVKCERCESVPSEPAVCLVCGTVVCLDSECCKNETNEGECNQHSKTCGAGQGMFILPLASVVVAVGYPRNCIWDGPYVDVHGEPDSYLKRSCQLRLDRRRLDQMRLSYTRGSIPIEIVRQNQISGRYVPRQL